MHEKMPDRLSSRGEISMANEKLAQVLSQIVERTKEMLFFPEEERVFGYRTIDPLLLSLEAELARSPNPYAEEKLGELKVHLIALSRLDDPDGHSDDEHCSWALRVVDELRSPEGFNAM